MKLRVGTRRSPLALTQTRQTMDELVRRRPGLSYELVEIVTTGDRITDRPLREAGGKGLFLKELDEALVGGHVDCAVHSMKDVPTELAPGTTIAAVLERADVRDVLVTRDGLALADLAGGAVIGTTSLRRQAQALAAAAGARVALLRGNVETRIRKLGEGQCDATFLAAAGLGRLGFRLGEDGSIGFPAGLATGVTPVKGRPLDPFEFVPAAGQGAIAITARAGDSATIGALGALGHRPTELATTAERAFARVFGGGCSLPIAAHAEIDGNTLALVGLLVSPDGTRTIRDSVRANVDGDAAGAAEKTAEQLGEALGRSFYDRGAKEIIDLAEGRS